MLPHEFSYRGTHPTFDAAFQNAKLARDAFAPLTAVATFLFAIWLTPFEDTAFDAAMVVLESEPEPLPPTWLHYLRSSIVCELAGGLRPGGFVDPYETQWSPIYDRFPRARVPLWLIWGDQRQWTRSSLEPYTRTEYFPPQKYIDGARNRIPGFKSIVLPLPNGYRPGPLPYVADQDSPTSPPHLLPTSPCHEAPLTIEWSDADGNCMNAESSEASTPAEVDHTLIIPFGSCQRPGESLEEFYPSPRGRSQAKR